MAIPLNHYYGVILLNNSNIYNYCGCKQFCNPCKSCVVCVVQFSVISFHNNWYQTQG